MKPINDGGHAFPRTREYSSDNANGMTLRDWFAGQCDVSIYEPIRTFNAQYGKAPFAEDLAEYVASIRLMEADAMIAAREAKP